MEKLCKKKGVSTGRMMKSPTRIAREGWAEKLKLYGSRCYWCGRKLEFWEVTQDHLTPTSRGGSDDLQNLVPACMNCNCQKNDKTAAEYREWRIKSGVDSPQFAELCSVLLEEFCFYQQQTSPHGRLLCTLIAERLDRLRDNPKQLDHPFLELNIAVMKTEFISEKIAALSAMKAMDGKPPKSANQQKKELRDKEQSA